LPKAEVNDTFTQTTLAMVAVSASGDVAQAQLRRGRLRRWWTGLMASLDRTPPPSY
jgi:hypothetical protein